MAEAKEPHVHEKSDSSDNYTVIESRIEMPVAGNKDDQQAEEEPKKKVILFLFECFKFFHNIAYIH